MLMKIYSSLLNHYGSQNWWPVSRNFKPKQWEICLGAILTQNTAWDNVEKALDNIYNTGLVMPKDMVAANIRKLKQLIRSSGYFNQKASRLKNFAGFVLSFGSKNFLKNVKREDLLKVNGIGKETADSILLYACNKLYFHIDAYTKRIFNRTGLIKTDDYEEIREFVEKRIPKKINIYKEYHALIVKHAKEYCRKNPLCKNCPLRKACKKYI